MKMEETDIYRKGDLFHTSPESVDSYEESFVFNHSNTFGLFNRMGNIVPQGKMVQGIYHNGTRFINKLILLINGHRPLLLSSNIREDNDIFSVDLTNPLEDGFEIGENSIHISRNQFVRDGVFYEEITCSNFGEHTCQFDLCLAFNSDFKDIFEIRGVKREVPVNKVHYRAGDNCCQMIYKGLDNLTRQTIIRFTDCASVVLKNSKATFKINLQPGIPQVIRYSISMLVGDARSAGTDYLLAKESIQKELSISRAIFANIKTSNEHFSHWLKRAKIDLLSLLANTDYGVKYPYAGVPWYNTTFGRDGLITAMETLWLAPDISRNVLLFLAATQATEQIPEKDAEPGKILHEARSGEMANTGEIPFREYYGTIDATPLFVMLAGMYYERTADYALLHQIWPNLKAALTWMDAYGDLDGDGFVEYQHKARNGLTNQGWKDSFDSVMHEDGRLAEPPIALCEVQGYVYGAKQHAAWLAKVMGDHDLSRQLTEQANVLKRNFNARFWDECLGTYVLALDGNKQPCRVISSNPGHCLFTGLVDDNKARKLADTLLGPEMFGGWGIRTLSSREKRYNPMSYHNGSVWPHDNALIAYGLARYGFHDHVFKIMQGLFEATLFIDLQRLPELYCGFDRRSGEGPTAYPVACSPQAWSVAVVFMLMQACLNIDIKAVEKTILFNKPRLPDYLEFISIDKMMLDGQTCKLHLTRLYDDVGFYLLRKPEDWELIIRK